MQADPEQVEGIPPALTAEDWIRVRVPDTEAQWRAFGQLLAAFFSGGPTDVAVLARNLSERRAAAAALALSVAGPDGGPLFTPEMLRALRACMSGWSGMDWTQDPADYTGDRDRPHLHALAAALASVLPPEQAPSDAEA